MNFPTNVNNNNSLIITIITINISNDFMIEKTLITFCIINYY